MKILDVTFLAKLAVGMGGEGDSRQSSLGSLSLTFHFPPRMCVPYLFDLNRSNLHLSDLTL